MMHIHISCGRTRKARKQREPLPLKIGDRVMRKSDEGHRVAVGTVVGVNGECARIRWPAPGRIGGEFLHSNVKLTSPDLQLATDEPITERRIGVRFNVVMREIRDALRADSLRDDWPGRHGRTNDELFFSHLDSQVIRSVRGLVRAGRDGVRSDV